MRSPTLCLTRLSAVLNKIVRRLREASSVPSSGSSTSGSGSSSSTAPGSVPAAAVVPSASALLDGFKVTNLRTGHSQRADAVLTIKALRPSPSTVASAAASSSSPESAPSEIVLWSGLQSLFQDEAALPAIEQEIEAALRSALLESAKQCE